MENKNSALHYVIEHFETEFSNWTLSEYVHMMLTLSNLYESVSKSSPYSSSTLILTNFPFAAGAGRGELKEDEFNSLANQVKFQEIRKQMSGRCLVTEFSF